MSPSHHPDDLLLTSYAAGTLERHDALIVATHAAMCRQCRETISVWECAGGTLLNDVAPVPLDPEAFARTLARAQVETAAEKPAVQPSNDDTPAPLRAFMGHGLAEVKWRSAGPGLHYATLSRDGKRAVRLLRGAAGTSVGLHTHKGTEYTLALGGGYGDVTGTYLPGDFQTADTATHHDPTVHLDGPCVILAVTSDYLSFTSWIQRVVGRMLGF